MIIRAWLVSLLLLSACSTGIPAKVKSVDGFELGRYLGTWYEIARLDHSFERGMDNVTANYSLRDDGGVRVLNRGFKRKKNTWDEAEGKAYFVGSSDQAHLKVSFFGPFYGTYIVFELDKQDYQYAMISGGNTDYLWILSRTPQVDATTMQRLLVKAEEAGYDTSKLIYVDHNRPR